MAIAFSGSANGFANELVKGAETSLTLAKGGRIFRLAFSHRDIHGDEIPAHHPRSLHFIKKAVGGDELLFIEKIVLVAESADQRERVEKACFFLTFEMHHGGEAIDPHQIVAYRIPFLVKDRVAFR